MLKYKKRHKNPNLPHSLVLIKNRSMEAIRLSVKYFVTVCPSAQFFCVKMYSFLSPELRTVSFF